MATSYIITGEKGHRQIVKTVDVQEESYNAFKRIIEGTPADKLSSVNGDIVEDIYNVFGGNVFGDIVHYCLASKLKDTVDLLAKKKVFKDGINPQEAFIELSEALFPLMCYSGEVSLYFFNSDKDDIINAVQKMLKPECLDKISEPLHFEDMDGKTALGLLIYLSEDNDEIDIHENELN